MSDQAARGVAPTEGYHFTSDNKVRISSASLSWQINYFGQLKIPNGVFGRRIVSLKIARQSLTWSAYVVEIFQSSSRSIGMHRHVDAVPLALLQPVHLRAGAGHGVAGAGQGAGQGAGVGSQRRRLSASIARCQRAPHVMVHLITANVSATHVVADTSTL
jgi:hypothetical protein